MKPIIFNTEMVRAILDGRKTATRRVVKPQPVKYGFFETHWDWHGIKPAYRPGDILYVRETWCKYNGIYIYKTHCQNKKMLEDVGNVLLSWRPSIHMPKEAARLFLRVTKVSVAKLQEITGRDVLAEGVDNGHSNPTMGKRWENMQRMAFSDLWNSTIKKSDQSHYGWDANPWVFVISFERISKDEAMQ